MNLVDLARRLGATTLFSPLPRDRLLALLERSPRHAAPAGSWVADHPSGLRDHLVLLAGEVEVCRRWTTPDGQEGGLSRHVAVTRDGPGFALVSAAGRELHVQALTAVDCVAIDSDELDNLLGWGCLGAFVLPEPHLMLFHKLPLEAVAQAVMRLQERRVSACETIVRQGEPGEHYYILLSGEADVWETDPATGRSVVVNRLTDGDGFGEEALLTDGPRTATVTMATPGELLVLARADFDALLTPPMVEMVDAEQALAMVKHGGARLLDCRQPAECADGLIPGAMQLPLDRLRHDGVFALEPDRTWIVCCRNGRRSRAATFVLRERGVHAIALAGGLSAWPYALEAAAQQP
jgi:rhodanese-related sulfurtransferase